MTPAISVCIPTYNGERFIGQAIASVLSQSFTNFELVIVDDASTDRTVTRIEQFTDSRIRLIRNTINLGLAGNWNKAVESCTAPLIKLLCHDDLIYRECLGEQMKAFTREGVGIVSARRDVIDESGRVVLRSRGAIAGEFTGPEMIRTIVRSGTNPLGEPSAVMFRREVFERCSSGTALHAANSLHRYAGGGERGEAPAGFRGGRPYMIDVDFYARALAGCDVIVLPATLSAFRVSRDALSSQLARSQSAQARSFFAELAKENPAIVSQSDRRIGQLRAMLLAPARRLFYRAFVHRLIARGRCRK